MVKMRWQSGYAPDPTDGVYIAPRSPSWTKGEGGKGNKKREKGGKGKRREGRGEGMVIISSFSSYG